MNRFLKKHGKDILSVPDFHESNEIFKVVSKRICKEKVLKTLSIFPQFKKKTTWRKYTCLEDNTCTNDELDEKRYDRNWGKYHGRENVRTARHIPQNCNKF